MLPKSEKIKNVDVSLLFKSRSQLTAKIIGSLNPEKQTFKTSKILLGKDKLDAYLDCANVARSKVSGEVLEVDLKAFNNLSDCQGQDLILYSPFGSGGRLLTKPDEIPKYVKFELISENAKEVINSKINDLLLPVDHEVTTFIQARANAVAKVSDKKITPQIFIVNAPQERAYTLPNGSIYLFRGLLEKLPSEASLVGLLGREWSHVASQHMVKQYSKTFNDAISSLAVFIYSGKAPESKDEIYNETFPNIISGLASAGDYSFFSDAKDHELEADRYGNQYAFLAGHNPQGLKEFLTIKNGETNRPGFLDQFKSSAANYEERITQLNYQIDFFYPDKTDWPLDSEKYISMTEALRHLPEENISKTEDIDEKLDEALLKYKEKFIATSSNKYVDEIIRTQEKRKATPK